MRYRSVLHEFRRGLLPVLVAIAIGLSGNARDEPAQSPSTSMRVDVGLVNLNVAVTDKGGHPYRKLKAENFRIYENGVEQAIHHFSSDDLPYSMGLILDHSGSMTLMIDDVYNAAFHTVRASKPEDEFFILLFNDSYELRQDFSKDRILLERQLQGVWAFGGTALYDAILAGLDHIKLGNHDKKALLVVTDGADNASRRRFEEVLERARADSVAIYVVGMFDETELAAERVRESTLRDLLTELAEATGGEAYFPRNVKECERVCIGIARELREQYTLGYYPQPKVRDGSWRTIQVQLNEQLHDQGLTIRTRKGYYAPEQ